MADVTNYPEQNEQSYLEEIEEGTIIDNLRLLSLELIDRGDEELDEATRRNLHAVKVGETRIEGDKTIMSIQVEYDTNSGRIKLADRNFQFGERSRLHTYLVTSGKQIEYDEVERGWVTRDTGTNTILLYQPGNMPTVQQYSAAMVGEEVSPQEDRRILPERIIPEHQDLFGIHEPWGQSEYVDNAAGDEIILKTIQQFNAKFGPPK